jgi:hypothetical protein
MRRDILSTGAATLVILAVCGSLRAYEPSSKYATMTIQGWKVLVNKGLLDKSSKHFQAGKAAMVKFHDDFYTLTKMLDTARLKDIQSTPVWLEVDTTVSADGSRKPCFHYHPGLKWLVDNDYNPAKHKCVEIGKAAIYARQGERSRRVMLHELAHSYHNRFLGFSDKRILSAYKTAKASGKYPKKIYAMTDFKEYFACLTVWCFEKDDRRKKALDRDPAGMKLVAEIWGAPRRRFGDDGIEFKGDKRKMQRVADELSVTPVPKSESDRMTLDPFYQKYCSASGFPVVASKNVADYAMKEAAYLIDRMLINRPDVREALIGAKVRFVIIGVNEGTTEMPEYRTLTPNDYWDRRARGLGATRSRPAVSCGEENLLRYVGDGYKTENILVHEFAHAIHLMGLNLIDKTFQKRLDACYRKALDSGLWVGKYAARNSAEYWAEGVQSWFGTNREDDHDHNHVNTRAELKAYDPGLARLVRRELRDTDWQYVNPDARKDPMHLKGYDRAKAPKFKWPDRLQGVYVEMMTKILIKRRTEIEAQEKKSGKKDPKGRAVLKTLEKKIEKVRKGLKK